jgi:hypothetical protein
LAGGAALIPLCKTGSLAVSTPTPDRVNDGVHPAIPLRLGDPPQGWHGLFDSDASTQKVIRAHATAMAARAD